MKKITLIAAAALMLGATSCNSDDDYKMETTYMVRAYSLVTDAKGNSTVSPTTYAFRMDQVNGSTVVNIDNLILDGVTATATTRAMPFVGRTVELGDKDANQAKWYAVFYLMEAKDATDQSNAAARKITDFMGDITTASNTMNPLLLTNLQKQLGVDPLQYPGSNANNSIYTETQYNIDDYRVMTFWCDMLYTGTTTTMDAGNTSMSTNKDGMVRVYLNLQKASEYKATIYFYNYKFSDAADAKAVDMKLVDVPVTFDRNGFNISGKDLVPVSVMDKKEMPEYTVSDLTVRSATNMTGVTCHFSLSDNTVVSFDGTGLYGYNISDLQK